MIVTAIRRLAEGAELSAAEVEAAMDEIFSGQATPAQIGGFLVGMHMAGETAPQVSGAARAMRRHALPVSVSSAGPILDTAGTGGDGLETINVSTMAAIVTAACGVTVAKHGNRAASSRCGSADLLEALGVALDLSPERIGACIDEVGIGFMFARAHHPAMRHASPVRAELGIRTIFNFLGPLTNPAGATHQLLGVGDGRRLGLMAAVLAELGCERAWVVAGAEGIDEVSPCGVTRVIEVVGQQQRSFELSPEDFGCEPALVSTLRGGDAAMNAEITRAVLAGEQGPRRVAVLINAAAALCVAGKAESPRAGVRLAAEAIDSGAAAATLARWAEFR